MRYLMTFLCVCVLAVTWPQSANAQGAVEDPLKPSEPAPSSEPASAEPSLQLRLDETGAASTTSVGSLADHLPCPCPCPNAARVSDVFVELVALV